MIRHHRLTILSILFSMLSLGACSDIIGNRPKQDDADLMRPDPTGAKLFFYVVYDPPGSEPLFSETFRFRADLGYAGEIDKDRFVELKVTPEEHTISADEVDWGGNIVNPTPAATPSNPHPVPRTSLTQTFKVGDMVFIEERIFGDQKPIISIVPKEEGMKAIAARKRECLC